MITYLVLYNKIQLETHCKWKCLKIILSVNLDYKITIYPNQ